MIKRVAWVVTGAGHFLRECIDVIAEYKSDINLFVSRAGLEVIKVYGLYDHLLKESIDIINDQSASSASCGAFAAGRYSVLVIAPATSNTVAKCALGIADSLPTNLFAQAGKSKVPIVVLPSDVSCEIESVTPSGKRIMVYPRPIDMRNVSMLKEFPGVTVVDDVEKLRSSLEIYIL